MLESQGGLFTTDQTSTPAAGTTVEQGTIEESNIQPVVEMTKLMDAAHQIGVAKNFADGEHTRLKNAIDRLGKTV
jgi:flagellar basal-body rod protein FlgF